MSLLRTVVALAIVAFLILGILTLWTKPATPPELEYNQVLWEDFQAQFVQNGRVVDIDNGGISHREGQGYGMIFAEAFGDREAFDDMLSWTKDNLVRQDGLLSWRWEQSKGVTDENNATDGDILVAWALLRAGERWNARNYVTEALSLMSAIRKHAIIEVDGRRFILPGIVGFEKPDGLILNPSYWVFPALDHFAEVEDSDFWLEIASTGEWLIEQAAVPPHGLVSDWTKLTAGGLGPAPDFSTRFSWDAVRVPLYIGWGAEQWHGLLEPYRRFWREQIREDDFPAWIDLFSDEIASYPAPNGVRAVANMTTETMPNENSRVALDDSYFSSSLLLLSIIAAAESGRGNLK